MSAARIVVTGRVQGVGFRQFVASIAIQFGIVGSVWNRKDGAVECVAQAPEAETLDDFVRQIWSGPGRVDSVEVEPEQEDPSRMSFVIGPTR